MSMNMCLDGLTLFQTPTMLTQRLVMDGNLSTKKILHEYLQWAKGSLGLDALQDFDNARSGFEHVDGDLDMFIHIMGDEELAYRLATYFEHEKRCNDAVAKGASFSFI